MELTNDEMTELYDVPPATAASDIKAAVRVSITVTIDKDPPKTFVAEATTPNDAYEVAYGVLSGLREDAGRYVLRQGRDHR